MPRLTGSALDAVPTAEQGLLSDTRRVAFLSPCGWGNLGDAAIIESLIHALRRRVPGVEITGFTLNPPDTTARHGVPAFVCTGFELPGYPVWEPPSGGGGNASTPEPGPPAITARARQAMRRVPGLQALWRVVRRGAADRAHWRRTTTILRGFDTVIVAGGGQLDDYWGGPFGHPYVLWGFAATAARVGARFVVLSVGTGSLSSFLSGMFVRRALALARWRSFRDPRSRELVGFESLTRKDPVVPDLAYAVPASRILDPRSVKSRHVIGVSPMSYADPSVWPVKDAARYERHVAGIVALIVQAARAGHEVVLFTSDKTDVRTVQAVSARLEGTLVGPDRRRVRTADTSTLPDLLALLGRLDVVVAARLHGVLLAHVAGRPTLAIAHERKVATLMSEIDQRRYCIELDAFDPTVGWDRLKEMLERRETLSDYVRRCADAYRRRVEESYDMLFGPPVTA